MLRTRITIALLMVPITFSGMGAAVAQDSNCQARVGALEVPRHGVNQEGEGDCKAWGAVDPDTILPVWEFEHALVAQGFQSAFTRDGLRVVMGHSAWAFNRDGGEPVASYTFIEKGSESVDGSAIIALDPQNLGDNFTLIGPRWPIDGPRVWLMDWSNTKLRPLAIDDGLTIIEVLNPPGWKVVLVKAFKDARDVRLIALDGESGTILWQHALGRAGYANRSMTVLDAERVLFASPRLSAFLIIKQSGVEAQIPTFGGNLVDWNPTHGRLASIQTDLSQNLFPQKKVARLAVYDGDLRPLGQLPIPPEAYAIEFVGAGLRVAIAKDTALDEYDVSEPVPLYIRSLNSEAGSAYYGDPRDEKLWYRDARSGNLVGANFADGNATTYPLVLEPSENSEAIDLDARLVVDATAGPGSFRVFSLDQPGIILPKILECPPYRSKAIEVSIPGGAPVKLWLEADPVYNYGRLQSGARELEVFNPELVRGEGRLTLPPNDRTESYRLQYVVISALDRGLSTTSVACQKPPRPTETPLPGAFALLAVAIASFTKQAASRSLIRGQERGLKVK